MYLQFQHSFAYTFPKAINKPLNINYPGPGTYDPGEDNEMINPPKWKFNRAPRDNKIIELSPGPAKYDYGLEYRNLSNVPKAPNYTFYKTSGVIPRKTEKEESKDLKEKRPQRRMRINLNNLTDKTPELSKNTFTFSQQKENEENKEEIDDNIQEAIEEDQCVRYEGYVYKYSQTQKKMKKTYFRLIGKDLYYYKKKEEKNHRGMHNLSGVFIKKGEDFEYDGKK